MDYVQAKRIKGVVYLIAFFLIALGFHFQPTKSVLDVLYNYGIHAEAWTFMFLVTTGLVGYQTILSQRWNFITFTPYFMYASSIFMLRVSNISETALSSVTIVVVLALVMLTDILQDWGR